LAKQVPKGPAPRVLLDPQLPSPIADYTQPRIDREDSMLASHKIMAFAPTLDANKARPFYEGVLGLRVISQDNFALALDANSIMLRVTNVPPSFKPQPFTILGWQVPDITETVSALKRKGVHFESYGLPTQDAEGIWTAPGGAKIAWFKDPDGNILSLTQFP
jgi:catechol 2,3-dioxygenase-like lactoylglutathione lyase family enzyme